MTRIELPTGWTAQDGCNCDYCTESRRQQQEQLAAMQPESTPFDGYEVYQYAVTGTANVPPSVEDADEVEEREAEAAMRVATAIDEYRAAERRKRIAQYKRRGIGVIPDDEVTDMGDYVIWNKYDPNTTVLLRSPERIIGDYRTLRTIQENPWDGDTDRVKRARYMAHPDKPVRVRGLLYDVNSNIFMRLVPGRTQRYIYVSENGRYVDNGRMETDIPNYNTWRPAITSEIPTGARRSYMLELARVMPNATSERAYALQQFVNSLAPASTSIVTWRGENRTPENYEWTRRRFKEIGKMVADAENAGVDEAHDLADKLDGLYSIMQQRIINVWNERAMDELTVADCGHVCLEDDTHEVGPSRRRRHVCQECFDDGYVLAEDAGYYDERSNLYEHDDGCWYTYAQYDDDDFLDDDDEDSETSVGGRVRNYSTNVLEYLQADESIKVSTYGEFLMGIELEVEPKRGCRQDTVLHTSENLCQQYAILKDDGSLNNGGFEIVTAPRGLKEHIQRFSTWKPHADLRAWDPGTCGMHVHISSGAFSQATLGKFIEFINSTENDNLIEIIAGRHPRSSRTCEQYCQREGRVVAANPKATLAGKRTSRYHMVNTCNLSMREAERLGLTADHANGRDINTIELRIFRATLKKSRMLAQIEFAHAAVMFCRWSSMRELRQEHFLNWLRKSAAVYPNLAKWFGVRANTQAVIASPKVRAEAEV